MDNEFISLNVHHSEFNEEEYIQLKKKFNLKYIYPINVSCKGIKVDDKFESK